MTDSRRQLSKFTAIFASGTLVSRVSGLVRDMVWFALIPTASLGPFLVAFKFPNMLRDLIGEGASNAAFVPVFSETIEKKSEAEFRELVSAVMSAMLLLLGVLTLVGVLVLPFLLRSLQDLSSLTAVDGIAAERLHRLISLSCWTFPYLFFIGMTVFQMAPLFVVRHYVTPSWSPVLLNIALIGSCLFLRDRFVDPAYALVFGIWLGGIGQFIVQYIALGKYVGVWWPNGRLMHPGIRTILWLLVPVLIGQATGEVNKLVDTLFAAILGDDKVKALFTANRLVQLPLSVFGIAVAAAILPDLSRAGARKDFESIRTTLIHGLRQTYFLVFPALLGLIVLRRPIVSLLFERGSFSATDTEQSATALFCYTLGLLSFVWVKILAAGFYAIQNTKMPVIVASASMLLNILLNCVLVGPLGYKGLALATSISFTVNFALLYVFLRERFGPLWDPESLRALRHMTIAGIMMAVVAYGLYARSQRWFPDDLLGRTAGVLLPVFAATACYAVLCYFLDVPDMRMFFSLFRRKRKRR